MSHYMSNGTIFITCISKQYLQCHSYSPLLTMLGGWAAPCLYGMACPQFADEGEGLQI